MVKESDKWFGEVSREPRLADQVSEMMLETILARGLQPGERLPSERELGAQFGVSRTVIREAVRSLAAKGVLEVRSGSGLRVASADPATVRESMSLYIRGSSVVYPKVHEVRTMLEVEIATLAAERATEDDLERLADAMQRMEQAVDDYELAATRDVEFHRAIAAATDNPLYVVLLDSIGDALLEIRRANLAAGAGPTAISAHRLIFDRIAARDPQGAGIAMHQHLDSIATLWKSRAERAASA